MVFFLAGTPIVNNDQNMTWNIISQQILQNGKNGTAHRMSDDEIKNMKLGNLDALLHAGEQMVKLETQVEGILRKIERQYLDLHPDMQHHDLKIETKSQSTDIKNFLTSFKWDETICSKAQSLPDKLLALKKKITNCDDDLRQKTNIFQEKKNIQSSLVQKEGNLFIKDLADVITPDMVQANDFIYTDHITTVVAVVPKSKLDQFKQQYQGFENVIPNSAKQFNVNDKDGVTLWRICFYKQDLNRKSSQQQQQQNQDENKRVKEPIEQYVSWARDNIGVTIREFHFNKQAYDQKQNARGQIDKEVRSNQNMLDQTCKSQFSLAYNCYMHLKVLRLYVDIASRFGQKETICKAIFEIPQSKEKKMLTDLMNLFIQPNQKNMYGTKEELEDTEDFFPFSYIPINIL